jgi:hypothetical protein
MKAFIASLCVLVALLGLILLNAAFVHRTASGLEARIEALKIGNAEALSELEYYWKEKKTLIGLSVSTNMIQSIDEHIAEMHAAIAQKDETELEIASRLALVAIERIRYHERCSIDNLL